MSIKLEITDPQSHGVLELRAIADFFSKLAAEKSGSSVTVEVSGKGDFCITSCGPAGGGGQGPLITGVGAVADPIDHAAAITETLESRRQRLHGNVASAGGDSTDPLTAAQVFGGDAPKPTTETAAAPVAPQAPSPSAPVAPTAPTSTAPAAPNQNSGIATDKRGIPYDKRIHSTPPSINKGDGLWRAKRGRDEIEAARIEQELLECMAIPSPTVVADAPKPGPTPSVTADPAPVAPQAPTAPVAPVASAPVSTGPKNLGELMTWAQAEVAAGRIASLNDVTTAAKAAGVAALPLLGTRPDLVPMVYAALGGK